MLFLVVSTPRPERPSTVAASRKKFWPWMAPHVKAGRCRFVHARAGRGAVALLDVKSNEELHAILNEWADIIPTHFDLYPLVETSAALRYLDRGKRRRRGG